jgi:hypothetical protein
MKSIEDLRELFDNEQSNIEQKEYSICYLLSKIWMKKFFNNDNPGEINNKVLLKPNSNTELLESFNYHTPHYTIY